MAQLDHGNQHPALKPDGGQLNQNVDMAARSWSSCIPYNTHSRTLLDQALANGVVILNLAQFIEYAGLNPTESQRALAKSNSRNRALWRGTKPCVGKGCVNLKAQENARPGSFIARDNVSRFITWCNQLGIPPVLCFESNDLVERMYQVSN